MSDITLLPAVTAFLAREHGVFIHGQHLASQSSSNIAVVNPANGQTIAHIADANQADVDHAVSSSRQGFTAWSHTSPAARAAVLFKLADLLEANREELAQLETLQSGKLIGISRAFEVQQAAHFLRYYAGWATKITGQTITPSLPSFAGERYSAFTLREPIGVVVGIVPWNFASMIAIWKLASALTTGCSIILKPSEFTPLTLLRIAELATEAGLPAGALNVLTGGGLVGKALIEHAGTDKVSFTGSVPTGIAVGQAAMGAKLTRATLELGGKNAVAFLPDVATDKAVDGIIEAGFLHSGQICAAGERFYVHRSRIDPLLDAPAPGPTENRLATGRGHPVRPRGQQAAPAEAGRTVRHRPRRRQPDHSRRHPGRRPRLFRRTHGNPRPVSQRHPAHPGNLRPGGDLPAL